MKLLFFIPALGFISYLPAQKAPEKPSKMADGIYNKYKLKLDTAILENDAFGIATQLANLEGNSDSVFYYIQEGIKQDLKNCDKVFDYYNLFKEHDFLVNLVKIDTSNFEKAFVLCKDKLGDNAYFSFLENKQREYEERISKRNKVDTTLFDYALISQLDKIYEDDQRFRKKMHSKINRDSDEYKLLWKLQSELDSINLIKVEKIIDQYGFINKEKVGYERASAILLVLHHQGDIELRMKYLPLLEKAVEDKQLNKGWLDIYKHRNELIILSKN